MRTLFFKELKSFFCSPTGLIIISIFLILTGLFLWLIPNPYNIIESGYASLEGLFVLAPWLFLFLAPAVSMRMFAEEMKSGTIELLYTRPLNKIGIILAKYGAATGLSWAAILLTLPYAFSVYLMGETPGNLDIGATVGAYIGLCFLVAIYSAIGIFASSLSANQIVAFILAALLCFIQYYGFELLASVFAHGEQQLFFETQGIYAHYESISRGVLDCTDLFYFLRIITLYILATWVSLQWKRIRLHPLKRLLGPLCILLALSLLQIFISSFIIRFDLTTEKRYSLSHNSRQLLHEIGKQNEMLEVNIFLEGDLNAGFRKLQKSLHETLSDFQRYAQHKLKVQNINPSTLFAQESGKPLSSVLEERGLHGINVSERNKQNAYVQKIVYPWVELKYKGRTLDVCLLRDDPLKSGHEDINVAIQELEYHLMDAIRQLQDEEVSKIAFLEGHQEYLEVEVQSISQSLSKYYQIDRGRVFQDPQELSPYKAIVVAGANERFTKQEKYILDQYLMNGGKIFWLLEGSVLSLDSLETNPVTVSLPNEINLKDQFFHYGIRINSDLIESAQCSHILMDVAGPGSTPNYQSVPWYFSPILFPAPLHPITKNINPVQSDLASSMHFVGTSEHITKTVLLTSSIHSKLHKSPSLVNLEMSAKGMDTTYFSSGSSMVAALLEGQFSSAFKTRPIPEGITQDHTTKMKSVPTKMIFVSAPSIIRNKVKQSGNSLEIEALGVDPHTGISYGNTNFLLNAINYLCDDEGWLDLRAREISIRLLSKKEITANASFWTILNLSLPLLILLFIQSTLWFLRRKYYNR